MTIGQRIAEKRKELNMSQEALGQQLGVSRQSVYKWESDGALPDIDKLVALSRLFGVTVGWLLGVEEAAAPASEAPDQEELLRALAEQYLAPRPAPKKKKLPLFLAAAGIAVLAVLMIRTAGRLEQMQERYNDLLVTMSELRYGVQNQIGDITSRVEQAVKGQNQITADYRVEVAGLDIPAGTVSLRCMALPKQEQAGMAAEFTADCGDGVLHTVAGAKAADGSYQAELICPLTDSITVSVGFVTGETRQNQRLQLYTGLYRDTMPQAEVESSSIFVFKDLAGENQDRLVLREEYTWIRKAAIHAPELGDAAIAEMKVGFFLNKQLVQWLEPCAQPPNYRIDGTEQFYRLSGIDLQLQQSDVLCLAVVITDSYGRQILCPDMAAGMRKFSDGWEVYYVDTPDGWQDMDWVY